MFASVAKHAGVNSVGIILTGMGNDGAAGLLQMKQSGAYTIAQNESTCVVFGMPKEAIQAGAVDVVLPIGEIPKVLLRQLQEGGRRAV
jgi:two-component system chemotaxis response regulator CheB